MPQLSCSVVIASYNGWELLQPCLRALESQTRAPEQVLVVDNGSRDGTSAELRRAFPAVEVLPLGGNLGFAAANNQGILRSESDVVVLLNNDTEAEPEFLARLLAPLEADRSLGAVAATMVFAGAPSVVASAGIEVYRNGLALDRALGCERAALRDQEVFGPSAGAAAYRRAALEDVGSFPETFFMYLEDVDLAWRLRLRGWRTWQASGAVVRHAYSASAVEGSDFKRRLLARNRVWLLARCLPRPLLARHGWRVLRYDALAFGYGLATRDWATAAGRVVALGGLGRRVRERRAIQSGATAEWTEIERWLLPEPSAREMLRLRHLAARHAVG
ncbi:MAG TPA: glycosyltransferase family 2 protein [Nitrolancea sp.]|nr:glycosyltransferase family 2 protein [Nitrolancea sp.]